MSLYTNLPSHLLFFKDEYRKELELPESWTSMLTGVSSPVEVIRGSNSRVWIVQLLKVTEHSRQFMLLDFGWEGFVNDNHICEGEILIVYYGGNRRFYVRIFSSSMVERFGSLEPLHRSMLSGGIGSSNDDFLAALGIGNQPWFPWVITPICYEEDTLEIPVAFGNQVFDHVNMRTEIQMQFGNRRWDSVVEICSRLNGNIHNRIMGGISQVIADGQLEYGKIGIVFLQSNDPIVLEIVFL